MGPAAEPGTKRPTLDTRSYGPRHRRIHGQGRAQSAPDSLGALWRWVLARAGSLLDPNWSGKSPSAIWTTGCKRTKTRATSHSQVRDCVSDSSHSVTFGRGASVREPTEKEKQDEYKKKRQTLPPVPGTQDSSPSRWPAFWWLALHSS